MIQKTHQYRFLFGPREKHVVEFLSTAGGGEPRWVPVGVTREVTVSWQGAFGTVKSVIFTERAMTDWKGQEQPRHDVLQFVAVDSVEEDTHDELTGEDGQWIGRYLKFTGTPLGRWERADLTRAWGR